MVTLRENPSSVTSKNLEVPEQRTEVHIAQNSILEKVKNILLKDGVRLVEVNELFRRYEKNSDPKKPAFGKYLEENYEKFYISFLESLSSTYKNLPSEIQLGDWLLFFGDLNQTQLNAALHYQTQFQEKKGYKPHLGKVLVANKFITKERLAQIGTLLGFMKLGEYLVCNNLVSADQMSECIKESFQTKKLLGMILVDNEYIEKSQLYEVLKHLKIIKTGEYFIYEKLITGEQLKEAIFIHKTENIALGEALIKKRYINREQLNKYLIFMGKTPKLEELSLQKMI